MSLDIAHPSRTRHPSLYFEDGDVILCANATDDIPHQVIFRVHRLILCFHSQVFRDMLTVGAPQSSPDNLYEGLPLVSIAGDNFKDVESLIEIMYDPTDTYAHYFSMRDAL